MPTVQPSIVVRGSSNVIKKAVLVIEEEAGTTFPPNEAPLLLWICCIQHALLQDFLHLFLEMPKILQRTQGLQPSLPSLVLICLSIVVLHHGN